MSTDIHHFHRQMREATLASCTKEEAFAMYEAEAIRAADLQRQLDETKACRCRLVPNAEAERTGPCWCNGTGLASDERDGMRKGILRLVSQREKAEQASEVSRASDKAAREALRSIREWDMINPGEGNPYIIADGRWLCELIDGVLGPR